MGQDRRLCERQHFLDDRRGRHQSDPTRCPAVPFSINRVTEHCGVATMTGVMTFYEETHQGVTRPSSRLGSNPATHPIW
jgi:hypothetical protein